MDVKNKNHAKSVSAQTEAVLMPKPEKKKKKKLLRIELQMRNIHLLSTEGSLIFVCGHILTSSSLAWTQHLNNVSVTVSAKR